MAINNNISDSGCGCLILLALCGLIALIVNTCDGNDKKTPAPQKKATSEYYNSQAERQPVEVVKDELSEEDKKYLSNSQSTGATPYTEYYGKNYRCPYNQCSGIKVTAPGESDIVVIIKRENQYGKVVAHGYIKAGDTYLFDIPDGTFQTFFYYGEGWNPNKEMGNGVKGGFIKNEIFSKDNPQDIYSGILTYVLQLQRDGNFSTKGSNRGEVF